MPHFLLQASYTAQWISGLVSSPEDRGVALRQRVESIGGRVESITTRLAIPTWYSSSTCRTMLPWGPCRWPWAQAER